MTFLHNNPNKEKSGIIFNFLNDFSEELSALWVQHSRSVAWQTLFMSLGLQDELSPEAHRIASAQAEPARAGGSKDSEQVTPEKPKKRRKTDSLDEGLMNQLSPVKTSISAKRCSTPRPALFGKPAPQQYLIRAAQAPDERKASDPLDPEGLKVEEQTEKDVDNGVPRVELDESI